MSEHNKTLLRRFTTEFINTASPALAKELISPTATFHAPGMPPMKGPDGYLGLLGMLRAGFPDEQWTLEDMVAEGD
jgi:predicted ester cyclase